MMDLQIHELVGATHDTAWLPWAVQYFFLIATSATALLLSLPAFVLRRKTALPLGRVALMVAVTTGITGPVALLADLHQPARFWHFYAYTHTTSWMAWGAWIVPLYVVFLLLFAWAVHRPACYVRGQSEWRFAWLFRWLSMDGPGNAFAPLLGIGAAVFALAVLTYTGAEVYIVRARPLWNTPLLPLQFLVTGFAGSLGMMLVLNRVLLKDAALERRMNHQLALTLAVVTVLGAAWFVIAISGISPRHSAALASVAGFDIWHRIAWWAAASLAVPFAIATIRPVGTGWLTGLIAIHAAWMFRWTVFMGGQAVPKVGSGLYDSLMPTGLAGLMGIVGTFGLWFFLVIVYTTFFPWEETQPPHYRRPDGATPYPQSSHS